MRGEWTDVVWLCIPAHARLYLLDLSIFSALNKKSLTHLERSDGRKSIILRLRQCSNKLQARNPNVEMYYHLGREWKFRPSLWVITRTGDKGGRRVRDSRIGRERTDAMFRRKQTITMLAAVLTRIYALQRFYRTAGASEMYWHAYSVYRKHLCTKS